MGATLGSLKPLLHTPVSALRGNHTDRRGKALQSRGNETAAEVT